MMPKTTPRPDGPTDAAKPAQATQPAKRFQLPALNLSLGSLTEGTDIPAPLPSPVQEVPTPPKTPPVDDAPKKESNGAAPVQQANGLDTSPKSDVSSSTNGGLKRPVDQGPVSPTYSSRGSLRRYLSKNLLHNAYDEQASISGNGASRPPSRTASITAEERKSKRGSGWFRRLRSNDSKRNSIQQFEEIQVEKKEPPPPMIPEMSAWEAKVDTAIGDDLFKGIK